MRAPTAVPFRVAPSGQRPGASGGSGGLAPGHAKGKLQPNGSVCGLSIPDPPSRSPYPRAGLLILVHGSGTRIHGIPLPAPPCLR